jgi:polygalacturonase
VESGDAALSALSASAGALSPAFTPDGTTYALALPEDAGTFTVTPTQRDPKAQSITVVRNGSTPVRVASGTPSPALAAPAQGGATSVIVVVMAEDGTTQTYTLAVTRAVATGLCGAAAAVAVSDPDLPAEPIIPAPCAELPAGYAVDGTTGLPVFNQTGLAPDTSRIQSAINACASGSVRLKVDPGDATHTAFLSGPLTLKANVTLSVDQGVTLFASRYPREYDKAAGTPSCAVDTGSSSGCKAFITVKGSASTRLTGAGIMGAGTIDGLGGEPIVGGFNGDDLASWWDHANAMDAAGKSFSNPRLIDVTYAQGFTLYGITLQNAPKFHVSLGSDAFVVWGVTIHTPSRATNSVDRTLSPALARNTDGIDPNGADGGWIVFSDISTGDDQIALKCADAPCKNINIAHDHLGTGHGLSIGSEINSGVDGLHVYDLSIDGLLPTGGAGSVNSNGLRIKSDVSRGGVVKNVLYEDVCMRGLASPILLNPRYDASATGSAIPSFADVTFRNVRHVSCVGATYAPGVTLNGYSDAYPAGVALDGVVVDGIAAGNVHAQYATVTKGPGPVNFTPAGTGVTVTGTGAGAANACAGKFVAMPWAR